MRHPLSSWKVGAAALAIAILPAAALAADINYGDFLGTGVDFLQVTESTQTAGDPDELWGSPALAGTGDQLVFFPPAFISSCVPGTSDVTTSLLTTEINAHSGSHIDNLVLAESGDVTLISSPPLGTSATNASASLSGTLTVTEDTGGPLMDPVVIPFNGSFSPKGAFELPTDFGTKTWSGTVAIDVAGIVPNAVKATLSLDNTLDSNCAVGSNIAKIQKKVVNGPTVAIMVNPIECALDVVKQCCVPQPKLPDLDDICDGELVHLYLEYTGDDCKVSNNEQGKKYRCKGGRKPGRHAQFDFLEDAGNLSAYPNSNVEPGDVIELSSLSGKLNKHTKFKITGEHGMRQHHDMDTSCERAIRCGDHFGAFKVVGAESTLGGYVDCNAPPPEPECAPSGDPVGTPCDAKVIDMVLEYNGRDCQNPLPNPQNGEASCSGDATGATNVGIVYAGMFGSSEQISPASNINDGDRVRVTSTKKGGMFPNQKLLITDTSGVLQEVDFHTSCSQPLALGDEFGSLKLVEFTTKNGTHVALGSGGDGYTDQCEVPLAPPKPHCTSDLESMTLVYIGDYLGEGCTVSNSQSGYGTCSGVADPGALVSVSAAAGLVADPTDLIEFGDLVQVTPDGGGVLPSLTNLAVTGDGGSQDLQIKTSCSKPLSLGDRFGSFVVFGLDRVDDGAITLGGKVDYRYQVTNPNGLQVDNVVVDDDVLGEVASGVSIPAGETVTFNKTGTLYGTTTNTVTATGDILGDLCDAGTDSVTVDVKVPPQGSFSCSCGQSLSQLTLIWDGVDTIKVKAWNGAPGSTLLATKNSVTPGTKVTVGGYTASDSTWEIFDAAGVTKLGESKFHLTCGDRQMNGVEDCGAREGNGRYDDPTLINDWLFEGMKDDDETLVCSPELPAPPPACAFGPELLVVLPGLMWLHRRRLQKQG